MSEQLCCLLINISKKIKGKNRYEEMLIKTRIVQMSVSDTKITIFHTLEIRSKFIFWESTRTRTPKQQNTYKCHWKFRKAMKYKWVLPVNRLNLKYANLHSPQITGTAVVSAGTQYNFFSWLKSWLSVCLVQILLSGQEL